MIFIEDYTMTHTESDLVRQCCKIARSRGLAAIRMEKTGNSGVPDYIFVKEGGQTLFVEFKRPDGRGVVSAEQRYWSKFLGYSHCFINNAVEFEQLIKIYFG